MNLYLLTQSRAKGYDTYNGAIVCAKNPKEAKQVHPNGGTLSENDSGSWVRNPDHVDCRLIGKAVRGVPLGVVLASFNAG